MKIEAQMSMASDGIFRMYLSTTKSNVHFLDLELSKTQFADLLSTRTVGDIDAEVRGLDRLDCERQLKTEFVAFNGDTRDQELLAAGLPG